MTQITYKPMLALMLTLAVLSCANTPFDDNRAPTSFATIEVERKPIEPAANAGASGVADSVSKVASVNTSPTEVLQNVSAAPVSPVAINDLLDSFAPGKSKNEKISHQNGGGGNSGEGPGKSGSAGNTAGNSQNPQANPIASAPLNSPAPISGVEPTEAAPSPSSELPVKNPEEMTKPEIARPITAQEICGKLAGRLPQHVKEFKSDKKVNRVVSDDALLVHISGQGKTEVIQLGGSSPEVKYICAVVETGGNNHVTFDMANKVVEGGMAVVMRGTSNTFVAKNNGGLDTKKLYLNIAGNNNHAFIPNKSCVEENTVIRGTDNKVTCPIKSN